MPDDGKKPPILPVLSVLGGLLVLSGLLSLPELSFQLNAQRAAATVESSERTMTGQLGQRGRATVQVVGFRYREADGTDRRGRDTLRTYWEAPEVGRTVEVDYIPGPNGSARLAGNGPKVMPALFVFCLLALVAVGLILALEKANCRRNLERPPDAEVERTLI